MINVKLKRTCLLIVLVLSYVIFLLPAAAQKDFSIEELEDKLEQYNVAFHSEKAYLLTDRFLYRPGETVWFQGFVSSRPEGRDISYSKDFFIKLMNNSGEEMAFRRYPINDNMVSGNLTLPKTLIPGKYHMVAYTGWMKNQQIVEAYRMEILVSKYFDKRFKIKVLYDKLSYDDLDTMKVNVIITDHEGKPVQQSEFEYTIESFTKVWYRGTAKTDERGNALVSNILPETEEVLILNVQMRRRKSMGSYAVYIPKTAKPPVISFYPEGGILLGQTLNKMAFRVTDRFGMPSFIEGEVFDKAGNLNLSLQSDAKGLGMFEYIPPEDTLFFRFTYPEGIEETVPLPVPVNEGIALRFMSKGNDSVRFMLETAPPERPVICYLVAVMDREIVWSSQATTSGKYEFAIPSRGLKPGIMQVSAFDRQGNLLTERLVQVEGSRGDLNIDAGQNAYQGRQRVMLSIDYSGPSDYVDLALSVSLDQMAKHDKMQDFDEVLNGFADDSGSFTGIEKGDLQEQELVVTDYRVVDWKKVLTGLVNDRPYGDQDGITGTVMDKKDNVTQLAKVRVTSIPSFHSYETQTDEQGRFNIRFDADIIDFNYLNVEAYDASGRTNLTPVIDYDYSQRLKEDFDISKEKQNAEKIDDILAYGDPDLIYALRYGSGRFRKTESIMRKKYDPYQYKDYSDVLDIIKDIRDYDLIDNKIVFKEAERALKEGQAQPSSLIVINGVLWGDQVDILEAISPSDITNLIISSSQGDIHRYTPIDFAAVIEITTIQGMFRYRKRPVLFLRNLLNPEHEFYTPDYSYESLSSPDNRKTLYWNTHIQVMPGSPALITFYTSDIKGSYLCKATGMDAEGNPVSAEFIFSVKE